MIGALKTRIKFLLLANILTGFKVHIEGWQRVCTNISLNTFKIYVFLTRTYPKPAIPISHSDPSFLFPQKGRVLQRAVWESLSGNSDVHFWLRTSVLECLGQWRSTGLVTVKWKRSPLPSSSNFPFQMFIIKRKCSYVVLKGFIFFEFWYDYYGAIVCVHKNV